MKKKVNISGFLRKSLMVALMSATLIGSITPAVIYAKTQLSELASSLVKTEKTIPSANQIQTVKPLIFFN